MNILINDEKPNEMCHQARCHMTSATNVLNFLKIDLSNKDHHRYYKSIDIGLVAGGKVCK